MHSLLHTYVELYHKYFSVFMLVHPSDMMGLKFVCRVEEIKLLHIFIGEGISYSCVNTLQTH